MQEIRAPTQHIMRQVKYSEFSTLFQVGNQRVFRFVVLYFQRCRKEKSCAAFLLFISAELAEGHKTMPPLPDCSGCSDKQLLMKERS
ncbi:hypothetical protein D7V90_16920 [bacterium 1xD42-87]|nr:hypothetical protein D7V90_16920 [bacterium 1xD42-87]